MSKGDNQSICASITQTADRYAFPTIAIHTPTPTAVKCPTMTPDLGHAAPPRNPLLAAAVSNAESTVYSRTLDATTLPTEGGDDRTVPGKTEANAKDTVVGSSGNASHFPCDGCYDTARTPLTTNTEEPANPTAGNAMLPDLEPTF